LKAVVDGIDREDEQIRQLLESQAFADENNDEDDDEDDDEYHEESLSANLARQSDYLKMIEARKEKEQPESTGVIEYFTMDQDALRDLIVGLPW
jgi:hypothetical protein